MFKNITLDMRLEDLDYKPKKIPDAIVIDCYDNKKFTKAEVEVLTDLATIYDIQLFTIDKNRAIFYERDDEDNTIFNYLGGINGGVNNG